MGISSHDLSIISAENLLVSTDCCREVVIKWLEGNCAATDYPVEGTWKGVIDLLEDLKYTKLAKDLETVLEASKVMQVI